MYLSPLRVRPNCRSNVRLVCGLFWVTFNTACLASRNYAGDEGRLTQGTAYVLPDDKFEVAVGLVGLDLPDFGAELSLRYGIEDLLELQLNVAHVAMGVLSVGVDTNLVDTRYFALGLDLSVVYIQPRRVWALPADLQEPVRDTHILVVPVQLVSSFPITHWFSAHVGLGYTHGEIFGRLRLDSDLIDAGVGLRSVAADLSAHFYFAEGLALILGVDSPLAAWGRENVELTIDLEPGVRAGVRSVEWARLPVSSL